MRKGFKWLLGFALVFALTFSPGLFGITLADTTQDVTINATPAWVSISNTPNTFDFGTVYAGVDKDTTLTGFNVTNAGSITCNITIKCNNWTHTSGSNDWTYGEAASDTARLMFGVEGGSFGTAVPDAGSSAVSLKTDLTVGTSQKWGLEIDAPTDFTHGDPQQTTVTLTATAV